MFKLNNLKAPVGSNHYPKRKGKGIGSGLGKTAGKGHKGQLARSGSGGALIPGFEGGQVPVHRRSPKVGFNSPLSLLKVRVNVSDLGKWAGKEVTLKELASKALAGHPRVKISVEGSYPAKKLPKSIEAHHVSPKSLKLLTDGGVDVKILPHMDGAVSTRKPK